MAPAKAAAFAAVRVRHDDEKAFLRKLLGDCAADAPTYTDRQITVVHRRPMCQLRIGTIGLPFGYVAPITTATGLPY